MHLYLITRGTKYAVNQFIDVLQGNMLPYPQGDKIHHVQFISRPVQLWECVFPKGCLPNVLKALHPNEIRKDISLQSAALRKILNAKKIPKMDLSKTIPINTFTENVAYYAIGIREDKGIWQKGHPLEGAEML